MKCDEIRPHCVKCTSTGRSCDGYEPGRSPLRHAVTQKVILPSSGRQTEPYSPPFGNGTPISYLTDFERRAFDFFVKETAHPLEIISPSKNWVQLALQISQEEPTVLQALVAVGSVHSIQIQVTHHTLKRIAAAAEQEDAVLEQYCKATSALQRYINYAFERGANLEPILLCCILFVVFEVFRGNGTLALSHLRHGQRAMRGLTYQPNTGELRSSPTLTIRSTAVTEELLHEFDSLSVESVLAMEPTGTINEKWSTVDLRTSHIPDYFNSIEHAKAVLDHLTAASDDFRNELVLFAEEGLMRTVDTPFRQPPRFCIAHCLSRTATVGSRPEFVGRQTEMLQHHEAWLSALSTLIKSGQHYRYGTLMQIQHFFSWYNLATAFTTTEGLTDSFSSSFVHILELVEEYLQDANVDKSHISLEREPQKSFSLEKGILPALYLICMKCRIPAIRTRALCLLRDANRREGIQWSREIYTYAESIAMLEERLEKQLQESKPHLVDGLYIPEACRFTDVVVEGVGFHEVRVFCGRFRHERNGELEVVEYRGTGYPPLVLQPLEITVLPVLP